MTFFGRPSRVLVFVGCSLVLASAPVYGAITSQHRDKPKTEVTINFGGFRGTFHVGIQENPTFTPIDIDPRQCNTRSWSGSLKKGTYYLSVEPVRYSVFFFDVDDHFNVSNIRTGETTPCSSAHLDEHKNLVLNTDRILIDPNGVAPLGPGFILSGFRHLPGDYFTQPKIFTLIRGMRFVVDPGNLLGQTIPFDVQADGSVICPESGLGQGGGHGTFHHHHYSGSLKILRIPPHNPLAN